MERIQAVPHSLAKKEMTKSRRDVAQRSTHSLVLSFYNYERLKQLAYTQSSLSHFTSVHQEIRGKLQITNYKPTPHF